MRLTFLGAAGEVTGSCLLVETSHVRFIVDCGMFQGGREAPRRNRGAYARDLGQLDFALLTHAHIDHCGLLPRFAQRDRLLIYCTKPTADWSRSCCATARTCRRARASGHGANPPRRCTTPTMSNGWRRS